METYLVVVAIILVVAFAVAATWASYVVDFHKKDGRFDRIRDLYKVEPRYTEPTETEVE